MLSILGCLVNIYLLQGLELDERMDKLCLHDVGCMAEPWKTSAVESVDCDKCESEKRDLILVTVIDSLSTHHLF